MIYDTGKHKWTHGKAVAWDSWDRSPSRWLLGPCPQCGMITSTYGGGFDCHDDSCPCSALNFTCSAGPMPAWWDKGINVKLDGKSWCATGLNFVNLQESPAGFGDKPYQAVDDLMAQLLSITAAQTAQEE